MLPVNNSRTDRDKTFSAIISWVSFYLNTWTPFLLERDVLTLFYGNIDEKQSQYNGMHICINTTMAKKKRRTEVRRFG
jgi:hypothetical protein